MVCLEISGLGSPKAASFANEEKKKARQAVEKERDVIVSSLPSTCLTCDDSAPLRRRLRPIVEAAELFVLWHTHAFFQALRKPRRLSSQAPQHHSSWELLRAAVWLRVTGLCGGGLLAAFFESPPGAARGFDFGEPSVDAALRAVATLLACGLFGGEASRGFDFGEPSAAAARWAAVTLRVCGLFGGEASRGFDFGEPSVDAARWAAVRLRVCGLFGGRVSRGFDFGELFALLGGESLRSLRFPICFSHRRPRPRVRSGRGLARHIG